MAFPSKAKFKKWLEAQPKGIVLARNWACDDCPLALFLTAEWTGGWYVSPDKPPRRGVFRPLFGDGSDLANLPRWANLFALAIDRYAKPRQPGISFTPVTAEDCLKVLASVR